MDLNDQIMKQTQSTNKRIENFLSNINHRIKTPISSLGTEFFNIDEFNGKILDSLMMDFDTPKAINHLLNTIDHIYHDNFNYSNLAEIRSLVSTFLFSLGLNFQKNVLENNSGSISQSSNFVESIIQIRNEIRQIAQTVDKPTRIQLFKLSDKIRDQYMPNLKVKLEDLPDSKVKWDFI